MTERSRLARIKLANTLRQLMMMIDGDDDDGDDDDGNNCVDDGYDGEAKTTVMLSNLLSKSESHLWKRINLRFDLNPRHLHSKEEAEWQYPQRLDI